MKDAAYWKKKLKMMPHPEGGYYKETYRSAEVLPASVLPKRFRGSRCFSTAIYFLLESGDISLFHRIKSEEIWHFYEGAPLQLHLIDKEGKYSTVVLGHDPDNDESLQVVVPAETWLGAKVTGEGTYTLTGCTVSPGFDFKDFELGVRKELIRSYPQHRSLIEELTRA
jgi:predicted cupin superfamily sugar epimerase